VGGAGNNREDARDDPLTRNQNTMPKTLKDFESHFEQSEQGKAKLRRQAQEIAALKETVNQVVHQKKEVTIELPTPKNQLKFGLFGDTQFGNVCERIEFLQKYCSVAAAEGVKTFFHTGDVLDGHKVYRGQEFDLHKHGWEEQSAWFEEAMPKVPGSKTYFITGNHDASFKNAAGIPVGKILSELRKDWVFLGEDQADVVIQTPSGRPFRVMLMHPGGGSSYAISYRLQKLIESLAGGSKPNLLAVGHYHKSEMLPNYRNVMGIQTGTFEAQTGFMKRGGLAAHMGGWIITVDVGAADLDTNAITAKFIAFY
jgi:hypothetical protein